MTPVPCRAVRLPLRLHPLVLALAALPLPLFAQEAAPAPSVNINEYIVRGNTVLDPRQIERAVEPFLGPGKTLADVENAMRSMRCTSRRATSRSTWSCPSSRSAAAWCC